MSSTKSVFNLGLGFFGQKQNTSNLEMHFNYHFENLLLLMLNRFTWNNLPKALEGRRLEEFLIEHGQVAFVDDSMRGHLILPSHEINLNVYGDGVEIKVTGTGYNEVFPKENVVLCRANDICRKNMNIVNYYATKLTELDVALQNNLRQTAQPFMIPTTKENELSMKNLMENILTTSDSTVYVDKTIERGDYPQALKTGVIYYIDKYQQQKDIVVSEYLTLIGVNNTSANRTKKERLVVAEVDVNNGEILANLELEFKHREKFCKEVNEKFGLNMSVEKTIVEIQKESKEGEIDDVEGNNN